MPQKTPQELPEGQTGQIKIDLTVSGYEIDEGTIKCSDGYHRQKIRKLKYPGLSRIVAVLEKTGAKVHRIATKGRFTIIDYIA